MTGQEKAHPRMKNPEWAKWLTLLMFLGFWVVVIWSIIQNHGTGLLPESRNDIGSHPPRLLDVPYMLDLDKVLAAAKKQRRPILAELTADTSIRCHKIDKNLFPNGPVNPALQGYVLLSLYVDKVPNDLLRVLGPRMMVVEPLPRRTGNFR